MTIEQQWRILENEATRDDGWRMQLARPVKGHPFFVGIEGSKRALLFRVPSHSIPPGHLWPRCNGLDLLLVQLSGFAHLAVVLKDARFNDVFSSLCEELISRMDRDEHVPAEPVAKFFGHLSRWQRFLSASPAGLSEEAQRGLWGELHFLNSQIVPALGGSGVLGWKGPLGANQDFQFDAAWVEVKTTLTRQPHSVFIANERQLDDTLAPLLFLHVLVIDAVEGGTDTLPSLIASIRKELVHAFRDAFEDLLFEAGYFDRHESRYSNLGYAVRRETDYRVCPGFPRIIEADLAPGIGNTNYELSLAACESFSTGSNHVMTAVLAGMSANTEPNV